VTVKVAYTLEQCWHRVPGGTASSALGVARAMQARDDVELVGVAARHSQQPLAAWRPPVAVHHLSLPRRALYPAWHTLRWPKVQRAVGPVDVIHATGMAVPPRSAPLVVTVHDLAFVGHPEYGSRAGHRFFRRSLALTRKHADLVLCPSEVTRRDCIAQGIDAARIRVAPWGVDTPSEASRRADRLAAYGLHPGRYVLWVGTVEPRKNLPALLDAFSRLGRHDLTLALVGPKGWNEDLKAQLAPIEDHVRVLGFVPPGDLSALYAHASVFCYPSLAEGFGMPVLEAMAAGAAVVTSKGTATEEVLGGCGITVDPHEPEAIADALAALVDDPSERARLAGAARARAATFTWDRTADLTVDAYRSVVT
jgi:glycosyltransferase involved in cell wall biosynthesis